MPANTGLTPATHDKFPIVKGAHATSCDTCHGDFATFRQFTCFNCHGHDDQALTDELHRSLPAAPAMQADGGTGYAYQSESCLRCHATGERVPFDHAGITSTCASCHDTGAPFVALPVAGVGLDGGSFTHPDKGGNDCRACHVTTTWAGAGNAPDGVRDPAQDVAVTALVPTWSSTSIAQLTSEVQALPMPMNHRSAALPSGAMSSCANCHAGANQGDFYPGVLHASLATQPASCLDCHATSVPSGFVGPAATSPARTPSSGEMRHDAVLWSAGKPTAAAASPQECSTCHTGTSSWATSQKFHASLTAAGLPQPASCLDCHANSRPAAPVAFASGGIFDHGAAVALGDCATCHSSTTTWTGGKLHLAGSATPATCLPCHDGERPTSSSGWVKAGFQSSPFDYGTNASSITHGAGQDCVACHANPGTGAWGGTQNWAGGHFTHDPDPAKSMSGTTCIACHMSQRPDLNGITPAQIPAGGQPFDHSLNGTGDCYGCHQATAVAGNYARYSPIPGSDWQGGVGYPGATLIAAPGKFITVTETTLTRSGANNLVTGSTSVSATLYNAMLHTSAQVPASMRPASSTDWPHCSMCHAVDASGVGSLANGVFHQSVTNQGQPQPTQCNDCHAQMKPANVVQQGGSILHPMDHAATSVTTCASCHSHPGSSTPGWADGAFHANATVGSQDCTACHYTLMADAASSDKTSGTTYAMRHKSGQLTFQNCGVCHTGALAKSTQAPAATLWQPGAFHPSLSAQPLACSECHSVSTPASATQSNVTYTLAAGATSSNQAQWMNHASPALTGKDCAACHAADAKASGAAWSKSDAYHAAVASSTTCNECHGTANGKGTVIGTNNNLPVGLTNSTMVTSADGTTGVPAGTHDQITHADVNATSHDCKFCHAQAGPSTAAGVQGKEWAQASFHTSFSASSPLVTNGSTGRCSNCHMNVKPTAAFTAFDHSGFTAAAGTQDCVSCHAWPGTGTATSPNWLGASAAPAIVTLNGWTSGSSITSKTVTFSHPAASTYTSCAQCHPGSDFAHLIDFNHDGLQSNVTLNGVAVSPQPNLGTSIYDPVNNATFCVACHNTGSPWVLKTGLTSTITVNTTAGSTTVTTASSSALVTGMTAQGAGFQTPFTANTTSGSTTVTTAAPVTLRSGTAISGPGIPSSTSVASSVTNATTFTLTKAATATATGVTLTAAFTVTIQSIPNATSFVVSAAAGTTTTGSSLTVTHKSLSQFAIGNHQGSTSGEDCTSCHYKNSNVARLTPPTAGVFSTGVITGN